APARDDDNVTRLTTLRDVLARAIMLPTERVRETLDDAVRRGRMTRSDAEDLAQTLIGAGRRQAESLLADLEQLLGRPRPGGAADALAFGGSGVARLEGYVVFVAGGVPGDRVRAVVTKRKRAYAEARAVEILEPSPDRIPARADHPGAPWQVLPYERQLEVKHAQ